MKHRRKNITRRNNITTGRRHSTSKRIAIAILAVLAIMMVYGLIVIVLNRPEQNSFSALVEESGITLPEDPVKRTLSYDKSGNPVFFDEKSGISATYHEEIDTLVFTKTASGDGVIKRADRWVSITEDQRKRLKEIVFGDGVSEIFAVEFDSFKHYDSLQTVVFRGDIEKIGDFAFSQSSKLRTVRFEGECHEIGRGAFVDCQSLTKDSINIPKDCDVAPDAFLRTALDATSTNEEK